LRLYKPFSLTGEQPAEVLPCLVYFHGGGFTLGDLDSHDGLCRALSHQGQCALVAVDYRLAPENPFPAAVEDAIAAVQWVRSQAHALGLDGARLAVGGDSAGGALAAVVAIALRNQSPALAMQLLLYPVTDMAHELPSHDRLAQGYGLTREALLWFRANYLTDLSQVADWRVSPLRADPARLAGLPPACVITAGFDPLLDEGRRYAERLQAAGVPLTYECFGGMIHGFMLMTAHVAAGRHAIYRAGQSLRATFGMTVPHLPTSARTARRTGP
jgi:acetyl esterase